jgi:tRNA A64-2'-O-ribosylphosphate transferase
VLGAEASDGGYIQGAGDDSEGWANGLTAPVFWENKDVLLKTEESELPSIIQELMERNGKTAASQQATLVLPSSNLYISQSQPNSTAHSGNYDLVIACNDKPTEGGDGKRLNLGCGPHKLGSRDLRLALDKVYAFAEKHLGSNASQSLLVTCETGKDLSVGTLLAIVCLFYDDNGMSLFQTFPQSAANPSRCVGKFVGKQPQLYMDKQFIRQRLAWIITSKPDANPSRATLQSVNAFLLQRPD